MIQIILKEDVTHLGKAGELASVKDGYARNFLFPQGLAVVATPAMVRQTEKEVAARDKREAKRREALEAKVKELDGSTLTLSAKVSEKGHLFGAVSAEEIATLVREKTGLMIEKGDVEIAEPIKTPGEHAVVLNLRSDLKADVKIEVTAAEAPAKSASKAKRKTAAKK